MAKKQAPKKRSWFKRIMRWFFFAWLASMLYLVLCKWMMPPITITQIGSLLSGDGLKRDYVQWNKIPANIRLAAMASEDQLFPDHDGFDWKSIEKSLSTNPKKKNKKRGAGASTISQQVAKNVFLWQGGGIFKYIRKVPEFYYTFMIELIWGKERILEVYLNVIEMGPGIYGAEAAAQAYFQKPAAALTDTEAALIIACLPNPKRYTVVPQSKFVGWKHRHILRQMRNIADDPDISTLCNTGLTANEKPRKQTRKKG
ncbi:MAG: monofunctional biosynthetic peptidoglycan transglycosylase [Chitinophagaceae bacterium]